MNADILELKKDLESRLETQDAEIARLKKQVQALLPQEGELTWEKVEEGIKKKDYGPLIEWHRRGWPSPLRT
jgi:hypothetical protein